MLANVFDDTQSGMQDSHIQGIRATVGNLIALLAIFLLVPYWPNVFVYAVAIMIPPVLLRFANIALILRQFPQILPDSDTVTLRSTKAALHNGLFVHVRHGLGVYATFRSPVLASATFLGVHETASISIINQFIQVGYIFGTVLSTAFVPAINASIAGGKMDWVVRSFRRLELFIVVAGGLGVVAFCVLGPTVHHLFLKESMHVPNNCLLFAGLFTAFLIAENLYFGILLSFRPSTKLGLLLILRAVAAGL